MSEREVSTPAWQVARLESLSDESEWPEPATAAEGWMPLRQAWQNDHPVPEFQPGWARAAWRPSHLVYDIVLAGRTFLNSARRLNELTWELGDVCEIFAEADGAGHYLEVHVTPDNQRLQLRFPPDAIWAVRRGECGLEQFMVDDPEWVLTKVRQTDGKLHVQARIPAPALGIAQFSAGLVLRSTVCRYDRPPGSAAPLLSSTAPLSGPSFHKRSEWSTMVLVEEQSRHFI